ncbi:MAG: hypothetical protein EOO80_16895, partial [Oxalobacteraceae bacterium]
MLEAEFVRASAIKALLLVSAATLATPLHAQQVTAQSTANDIPASRQVTGVADIVVTAQRREQSLQDVPISITAL